MKKIAITIPEEQMRAIERIRRQQNIPRSCVIQQAVTFYLGQGSLAEDARAYEEGYRRKPEREGAGAYARAAAEALSSEDWT